MFLKIKTTQKRADLNFTTKQIKINNLTWFASKSWIMSNTEESKWLNYLVKIGKVNSNKKLFVLLFVNVE